MIKVGHKPFVNVGTGGHPDHRKEMERGITITSNPPIQITEEEFKIAYSFLEDDVESVAELLKMRIQSQLYQAFKENPTHNNLNIRLRGVLNEATKIGMFNCDPISDRINGEYNQKHKHPHWHKSRW